MRGMMLRFKYRFQEAVTRQFVLYGIILLLLSFIVYLYWELTTLQDEFHDFKAAVHQDAYSLHIKNLETQVYQQQLDIEDMNKKLWYLDERTNALQFRVLQNEWDITSGK